MRMRRRSRRRGGGGGARGGAAESQASRRRRAAGGVLTLVPVGASGTEMGQLFLYVLQHPYGVLVLGGRVGGGLGGCDSVGDGPYSVIRHWTDTHTHTHTHTHTPARQHS